MAMTNEDRLRIQAEAACWMHEERRRIAAAAQAAAEEVDAMRARGVADRPTSPRPRLYATRRDHLRSLWVERLRAAAEAEEGASDSPPWGTPLGNLLEWMKRHRARIGDDP